QPQEPGRAQEPNGWKQALRSPARQQGGFHVSRGGTNIAPPEATPSHPSATRSPAGPRLGQIGAHSGTGGWLNCRCPACVGGNRYRLGSTRSRPTRRRQMSYDPTGPYRPPDPSYEPWQQPPQAEPSYGVP